MRPLIAALLLIAPLCHASDLIDRMQAEERHEEMMKELRATREAVEESSQPARPRYIYVPAGPTYEEEEAERRRETDIAWRKLICNGALDCPAIRELSAPR